MYGAQATGNIHMAQDAPTDEARDIALDWLVTFSLAVRARDASAVTDCFIPEGWFRDLLAISWQIRSLEGSQKIHAYLAETLARGPMAHTVLDVKHYEDPWIHPVFAPAGLGHGRSVEVAFDWETTVARGKAYARLVKKKGDEQAKWKALSVCMFITDVKGHEAVTHELGIYGNHTLSWESVYAERRALVEAAPQVLIVGAGQNGLQIGAACKQMGIRALLIDRDERVGDLWRRRYPTLALHTTRRQHELLFQPYPTTWPEFMPKDKYADWLEGYAKFQDLIVWNRSQMIGHPVYNDDTRTWDVIVDRAGQRRTIYPSHIIMATGALGGPIIPSLPGRDLFKGTVLHAERYQGGFTYANQRVVVVGAGNTGIDICQDLCFHKAQSVTMVQRSVTCVVDGETSQKGIHRIYRDDAPTYVGDLKFLTMPIGLLKKIDQGRVQDMWDQDAELFEKLRKGGVKLYMGPENAGMHIMVYERGGGYWVDKGGADLIVSGAIKVKQGTAPVAFTTGGIEFSDGTTLDADSVVFATGYASMRDMATSILGEETMARVTVDPEIYGLDSEGEIMGSYKPTGHPGLWFGTGGGATGRTMSKFLAIQLKAIESGLMSL
ncbi:hypothetical protein EIP91_009125 [Steccherinum ochraceum]|uniref:FAD/NAD(P)-binding domain-containing protein n=1 Tax=Steccherinum ochraceum TaxID=92696 RepID=A0A4R0R221_9APHY|nr:hypothetical protein EIP91_009125 [Steccherinum ochraceum]